MIRSAKSQYIMSKCRPHVDRTRQFQSALRPGAGVDRCHKSRQYLKKSQGFLLCKVYDKFFSDYDKTVAQILLNAEDDTRITSYPMF